MARGYNKVILIGNLAGDPELGSTSNKNAVAKFRVAVNRQWKSSSGESKDEVDFIPVAVWGKSAEHCKQYLTKGSQVLVEGRLSVRNYEATSGEKKTFTEVIAISVQFLGSPKRKGESEKAGSGEDDFLSDEAFSFGGDNYNESDPPF